MMMRGLIVAVGAADEIAARQPIAAHVHLPDHIVAPARPTAYWHSAMTLLRGAADDPPLERWLKERIWPMEAEPAGRTLC